MRSFRFISLLSILSITLLVFALTLGMGLYAYADTSDISVYVDGVRLSLDESPRLEDGRTLVPMRAIFEALGADVDWDEDTLTASAKLGGDSISVTVDDTIMIKNDEEIELDVPARIFGNRTLVPVRAISEAFGSYVDWDEATSTVFVDSRENPMHGTSVTNDYRYPYNNGEYGGFYIFSNDIPDYFGMELIDITDEQCAAYADTVSAFADAVPYANVYCLAAPTAAEFYAPTDKATHYTSAIHKVYSLISENVTGINAVSSLFNHADENIFFKTDHHWTQLGAYYAYEAFISELGDSIDPYYSFDVQTDYAYYGSLTRFTSGTDGYDMLMKSPDILEMYMPKVAYTGSSYNDMYMYDYIKSMEAVRPSLGGYTAFLEGDYPIEVFNTGINNGRKLVIIKESYGNAFATWALNNFETVYVVDYRKFNDYGATGEYPNEFKISEFYEITGFTDLVVINYPVAMQSSDLADALRAAAR